MPVADVLLVASVDYVCSNILASILTYIAMSGGEKSTLIAIVCVEDSHVC